MTTLPTAPPFPDPSSAQADLMLRELYSRVQTLETIIRTSGGGGDGEDPETGQLRVLFTTPVRLFEAFVPTSAIIPPRSVGFFPGGRFQVGVLEPNSIVLSVTASISEAFDDPGPVNLRFIVGTDVDHPALPPDGQTVAHKDAWRVFFARSGQPGLQNLSEAPFDWVNVNMVYPWDSGGETRQGVGRLLTTRTRILAAWEGDAPAGVNPGNGTMHVRVLYVDSSRGTAVDSLADVTLLSPIPVFIPALR